MRLCRMKCIKRTLVTLILIYIIHYIYQSTDTRSKESEWIDPSEGSKYSNYGDGSCINSRRSALTEVLKYWVDFTEKHGITYYLAYGSLLGAWRDGDIVRYDSDIDVLVDESDNFKLDRLKDENDFIDTYDDSVHLIMQHDWKVPTPENRRQITCDGRLAETIDDLDSCTFQSTLGRVIKGANNWLDLWNFKREYGLVKDTYGDGTYFNMSDVFPLKKCKYMGFTMYCPNKPKALLVREYGAGAKNLNPIFICKDGQWEKRTYPNWVYYRNLK